MLESGRKLVSIIQNSSFEIIECLFYDLFCLDLFLNHKNTDMDCIVSEKFKHLDNQQIWDTISEYINNHKSFCSITGIIYSARIEDNTISYKGGSGNRSTGGEYLTKHQILESYRKIKDMEYINTSNVKDGISKDVYMKRTPLVGLFYSCGIISII